MKGVWSCVWRGALGGIMGSIILLLLSALNYRLTLGYIPYSYLFIVAGVAVALPVGIMIGAIIGVVIRLLEFKTERSLGVVMRALAGVIIALITSFGMSSSSAKNERATLAGSIINSLPWMFTLGVLPGIMERRPRNNRETF